MAKTKGPMSGFRDMLADQVLPRENVLEKIKQVYELYGFVPLKTPALELLSTLSGKYGEEGDKLMYSFLDNGEREVAMRYDLTVPLARVVASYSEDLPKPYKRYALGDVWRGESPQAGRYREFTQFDADIVGTTSALSDVEILLMTAYAMRAVGVKATIYVNDRRLFDGLTKLCGIDTNKEFIKLVTVIDKIDKIGKAAVLDEVEKMLNGSARQVIDKYLSLSGDSIKKLSELRKFLDSKKAVEGLDNLEVIFKLLKSNGGASNIVFDQTIARGLSYYTGTIFETKLDELPSIGSVCSGGRYDHLIKQLGGPDVPAIGTSIGVDRLMEGMAQLGLISSQKTTTKVYIVNLDPTLESDRLEMVSSLRKADIAAELIYDESRLKNQLRDIDRLGVEQVIVYGQEEKKKKIFVAKDLVKKTQTEVPITNLVNYYKKLF